MANLNGDIYKSIYKTAVCPILIFKAESPQFIVEDVNEAYLEATAFKREDILGKGISIIFFNIPKSRTPQNFSVLEEALNKVLLTRNTVNTEERSNDSSIADSDDSQFNYWESVNRPVFDSDGNLCCIMHMPSYHTHSWNPQVKRKTLKEEASHQRKKLQSIFIQAPVAIGIYNGPDFIIEVANPALCKMWDRNEKDVIGKSLLDILPYKTSEEFKPILKRILNGGEPFVGLEIPVSSVREGDNHDIWFNLTIDPFYDNHHHISGLISVALSVTDQVKLRKKLEESEHRLQLAVESSNVGIWDLDLKTRRTIKSAKVDEILGYKEMASDWSMEAFLNLVVSEDRGYIYNLFNEIFIKDYVSTAIRIQWQDKSIHCIQLTGKVFRNENDDAVRMLGTIMDITEIKELERRKDELLSVVSHELKTPVTSIKAYAQVLERKFGQVGDSIASLMLKRMVIQLSRLTSLIHDLLDTTRIEGGKLQLRPAYFVFNELVHDTISQLERIFSYKIIVYETNFITCYADKERTEQVLINLITNAIKYSPGKDLVEIFIETDQKEVICKVRDFGLGIQADKQKKIFERFYRATEESNFISGLGLGLYISSEIIQRQNGKIWFNSTIGEGSTFCFSLPLYP